MATVAYSALLYISRVHELGITAHCSTSLNPFATSVNYWDWISHPQKWLLALSMQWSSCSVILMSSSEFGEQTALCFSSLLFVIGVSR